MKTWMLTLAAAAFAAACTSEQKAPDTGEAIPIDRDIVYRERVPIVPATEQDIADLIRTKAPEVVLPCRLAVFHNSPLVSPADLAELDRLDEALREAKDLFSDVRRIYPDDLEPPPSPRVIRYAAAQLDPAPDLLLIESFALTSTNRPIPDIGPGLGLFDILIGPMLILPSQVVTVTGGGRCVIYDLKSFKVVYPDHTFFSVEEASAIRPSAWTAGAVNDLRDEVVVRVVDAMIELVRGLGGAARGNDG